MAPAYDAWIYNCNKDDNVLIFVPVLLSRSNTSTKREISVSRSPINNSAHTRTMPSPSEAVNMD